MSVVEVEGLYFDYGDKKLFTNASLRVFNNDHLGVVGLNGVGKTTLLNLLVKNLSPDKGKIIWDPSIRFGYLDQHADIMHDISIKDYLLKLYAPLFKKEEEINYIYEHLMEYEDSDKMLNKAYKMQEELEREDFYSINTRIETICSGLGLNEFGLDRKLNKLSGGQREKVILAKLLLEEPDVLIMDEPTNFLDVAQIEWLSKYLNTFKGAFIVVSHDVSFLNEITNSIACVENSTITKYKGNYDAFLMQNEAKKEEYEKLYNRQRKFIAKTQEFIDKNLVRATTTKQAQSRRKMLEKLDILEKPTTEHILHFKFPYSSPSGKEVLHVNDLTIGYEFPILENLNFDIKKDEIIVLVGHNGVGKSTFIKTVLGIIPPLSGSYKWGEHLTISYFAQDERFYDQTPLSYIHDVYPEMKEQELRALLASFGVNSKLCNKSMLKLSGGEQTKVRMALMSKKKSNLLILDEPTNHLDVSSKESLKKALKEYPGTVIVVSHEKYFYEEIATRIISIKDKK